MNWTEAYLLADMEAEKMMSAEETADRIKQLVAANEAQAAEIERLRGDLKRAVEAGVDVAASLSAAISLLQRGGKKAAPSDKMFNQMLADYNASLDRLRTIFAEPTGEQP
jgi:uncharacterized NAD-dependent epimerase/dehydratase family protein